MKLSVFGKTPEKKAELREAIKQAGFIYSEKQPDIERGGKAEGVED